MRFAIPFRPRLVDTLRTYTRQDFTADLTAGVTVGIVALPLAMAFAIASGVTPQASRRSGAMPVADAAQSHPPCI